VVSADEKIISLMLIENLIVQIPRDQIQNMENEMKSLMYEGLIQRMTETEVDALLNYIVSLSDN
jgi:hypothetical protein